jgi:hypothetical protein
MGENGMERIELNNKEIKKIVILPEEIGNNYDVTISYMKLTCNKCFTSWGITPINGIIVDRQLICRHCNE